MYNVYNVCNVITEHRVGYKIPLKSCRRKQLMSLVSKVLSTRDDRLMIC